MSDWMEEKVREFHKATGQPAPEQLDTSQVRTEMRARLLMEETLETIVALGYIVRFSANGISLEKENEPDWPEVIDGACDVVYVALGLLVELGIGIGPFFHEVHRSNMTKVVSGSAIIDEHGKIQKPPSFELPRIGYLFERLKRRRRSAGYGQCPFCSKWDVPNTRRERRPNGNTTCGGCGKTGPSKDWTS